MAAQADLNRIDQLAERQDGVMTRGQLLAHSATSDWITRQVRGRRWTRLFPGVYLTHTGRPEWRSKARAALLYAGRGAVLSHSSAAYRHRLVDRPGQRIEVLVPHGRTVRRQPGLTIRSSRSIPPSWGALPATNPADTLLDLLHRRGTTEDDVIALLNRAVRVGVDLEEIRRRSQARGRLRHRGLLGEMLTAAAEGVESPLELRYRRIERAHGLPVARLQAREVVDGLYLRADCRYVRLALRVELDGQVAHRNGTTDADVWRDNVVGVAAQELTLRYRWRHVTVTPCAVARQVALALLSKGWTGRPRPCGPECDVAKLPECQAA
ncbi:hypothetical protein GCM10023169_41490 [Georgenia halophila]|uniref:Transcriptional regulator, AbiEi antitoxin, Type IV TA system n=1 Tax=Georgenia halophila TaxID=620889 RepID=A0ABP8LQH0_9MICO